ncbi:MAG: RagB/SusD family nutrient uptake outer membrane protein [Cyclobacteriaceae bacterium]|nr:RagB/SusD family nutrient uptake outer membrane protein [Cyclobacteriaceae bacterium]
MKKHRSFILTIVALLAIAPACNDLLNESPKTAFTTDYYKTAQGFQDGLNAAYSYLRFQYGSNPALGLNITGTDEFTFGPEPNYNSSGDNQPHKLLGTYDVTPQAGYLGVTFNRTFPVINTLNGLVALANQVPTFTDQQYRESVAQARYLRAHYYYLLVGHFGAVPLDLGSGELAFNTIPYTGFNRGNSEAERQQLLTQNYQVMIDDLTYASENLPDQRLPGEFRLSKAVAFHLLAKVYLARHYSAISQTSDAQNAYNAANEVVSNPGKYGVALQQNFEDVFRQGNDYNSEILLAAERIPGDYINNGYLNINADGIGDGENMAANCFTSNYEQPLLQTPANLDIIDGRPFAFQRPLRKLAPTRWLTETAFADKVNDSRYHGSFRTLWTADTQNESGTAGYNTFINTLTTNNFALGDTAFYLADSPAEAVAMGVDLSNPASFGTKYYRVYSSHNWYSNQLYAGPPAPSNVILVYPSLKKFNDVLRASPNGSSGRPMPIFRLAETYLLAAEAAFETGNAGRAAELINVIRTRAAYRTGLSPAELTNRVANMQITSGDVTFNFIMDERARELAGEGGRWTDLALRGGSDPTKFISRVNLNEDANGKVEAKHRLRPIPQSQLDAISDTDKQKYQNPGY